MGDAGFAAPPPTTSAGAHAHRRLVLASGSPRRRELLEGLGLVFEVRPADIDEAVRPGESGVEYVERLARAKAIAVAEPGTVTIAADTTVELDGVLLGKPADPNEARALLRRLSGRTHQVHTGVAVARPDARHPAASTTPTPSLWAAVATTEVTFSSLPDAWIDWFVATDEPYDKAGGYGIQGAAGLFVTAIEGGPSNVVGLPLDLVARLVSAAGHDLLSFTS